jgi:hypothetical protein
MVGIQLISIGLLGEMLRNVSYRAEEEYCIKQIWDRNRDNAPEQGA